MRLRNTNRNLTPFVLRRLRLVPIAIVLFAIVCLGQKKNQLPALDFDGISMRGRMLAEYDAAGWHSTDAVLAMDPQKGIVTRYVGKKTDTGWVVVFGRFNDTHDKFLIVYEATQQARPEDFKVEKHDPPLEDSGFYLHAANGIETALRDFQGENRSYNASVLPAESNQMYVYVVPAQTKSGIYPLGGDVRYLMSSDGATIEEKRQLHKSIIEVPPSAPGDRPMMAGIHSHVLSDVPEDTDVFHVLVRKPSIPENVGTKDHTYLIQVDGTIKIIRGKK
jgi:hypothetical protein